MTGSTYALIDLENIDSVAGWLRWGDGRPTRFVGNCYHPFFDLEALAGLIRERFAPVQTIKAFAHLNRFLCYEPVMARAGIVPVDVPSIWRGKNAADIAMAYDAAECVHTNPAASTLLIASHDSDFRPVVFSLKKAGKRAVGLGLEEGNCCDEWVEACAEFVRVPCPDDWGDRCDDPPDEEGVFCTPDGRYGYGSGRRHY